MGVVNIGVFGLFFGDSVIWVLKYCVELFMIFFKNLSVLYFVFKVYVLWEILEWY